MDFFILHKVLRMFRFTPLEMAKNFKNFIKAFFEVNHLKWSRTKQIHLCLGLKTNENSSVVENSEKSDF